MLVNLKRDWFAPGGKRFRAAHNPNVVPDKLPEGQKYPKDMEILDKNTKAEEDLLETQLDDPVKAKEALSHNDKVLHEKKEAAAKAEEKK